MIPLPPDFLCGSYPPIVTPFRDGRVDLDAYARLIEFQIAHGTHGVVVNGTTSEPTSLTVEERNLLVRTAIEVAARRIPVVAQTGSQSHAESVALTEFAAKAGADALMVLTPYFVRAPQRGVVAYFADLGRRTSLPLLMYHIPGRSAFKVELDTLVQIAEALPNFVGIKHAVDDHSFVTRMIATLGPDFRIFVGLEEFTFPMMALGAQGTMNAVANVAPAQVAALCNGCARAISPRRAPALRAVRAHVRGVLRHQSHPDEVHDEAHRPPRHNEHRLPMVPATPELERRLDGVLRAASLLSA